MFWNRFWMILNMSWNVRKLTGCVLNDLKFKKQRNLNIPTVCKCANHLPTALRKSPRHAPKTHNKMLGKCKHVRFRSNIGVT